MAGELMQELAILVIGAAIGSYITFWVAAWRWGFLDEVGKEKKARVRLMSFCQNLSRGFPWHTAWLLSKYSSKRIR